MQWSGSVRIGSRRIALDEPSYFIADTFNAKIVMCI